MNRVRSTILAFGVATIATGAWAQISAPVLSESSVLASFPQQAVRPGRDRFNNDPAPTTEALAESLKTNKTFRTNLARHFGVPEERVVEFVQDALVPQLLTKDTRVMNYGVTKQGKIYGKTTTLKRGTRVWATREGKPILKWDCSNPLLPKAPVLRSRPKTVSLGIASPLAVKSPTADLLGPSELEAPLGITLASELPIDPIVAPQPKIPISVVEEPKEFVPTRLPSIVRTGLPLLPLAGVVGLVVRTTPTLSGSVPEPTTLVLLTLGTAGLLLTRRRL